MGGSYGSPPAGQALWPQRRLPGTAPLRLALPFLVRELGFWDKYTGICAGAMSYRRDFPAIAGIYAFEAEKGMILSAIFFF